MRTRRAGTAGVVALAILLLCLGATASPAYAPAHGFTASSYATGFPWSPGSHWGPLGISFDSSDNLYVSDPVDGNLYRFQPGGGSASPATRLTLNPIAGVPEGLAIDRAGRLYLARYGAGDVVQVDPETGQVLRTVASVACATGLAVDPASGDLFVSQNQCGDTIYRVTDPGGASPATEPYASAPGVDGLAFDQDGSLYAESDGYVLRIDGTYSSMPGLVTKVARVPEGDGLAFGAHSAGGPPWLVVNRNDGIITRVDFSTDPPGMQDIFSGGSRGDFAAVDSAGCLYATQTNEIVRIASSGDRCAFEPTTPGARTAGPPRLIVTPLPSRHPAVRRCGALRTVTLRLSQRGRVRLVSAVIYLGRRRLAVLRGSRVTAPLSLRRLPASAFTLKVVARTSSRRTLVSFRRFRATCPAPARKVSKHGKTSRHRKTSKHRKLARRRRA